MLAAVLVLHRVHALTTTSLGRERWEIAESVFILALMLAFGIFALGRWRELVRETTERERAEEALRETEERYRTSVENMLDCFGIYSPVRDQSGHIVDFLVEYVNEAACRNNLMSKEQQIGKRLLELLPAHRETGLFDDYCRLVQTGEPLAKEQLVYEDVYGSQRLSRAFDVRAVKLGDGFAAAWRDVTERKRMEEALQEAREELEGKVERQMLRRNPYGLTFREFTVLHLVAAGRSDREIGITLSISHLTAQKHISNILAKMHASSRTEAGVRAVREGLLE